SRRTNADGSKESVRAPVVTESGGGYAFVDAKGRFVIEGLAAGEYDLFITTTRRTAEGRWESVNSPGLIQRVTVRENDETSVTITLDLNSINQPKNQPQNQEDRQ